MDLRLISMTSLNSLNSWHSNWKELRVLIYGVGVSGFSAADTLQELGAKLLVVANRIDSQHADLLSVLGIESLESVNVQELVSRAEDFSPELVIVSPGIKPTDDLLAWAAKQNIAIWGDIELAWRLRDKTGKSAEWLMITGTNGKTTTTQLVEHGLLQAGKRVIACGNIGTPVLDAIRHPEGFDYLVVEISSFQLHYLPRLAPYSSAVLNVAEDHLDWHGSFDAYIAAKAKVYEGTKRAIIYNVEDPITMRLVQEADVESEETLAVGFTKGFPADLQVGFVEDSLIDRAFFPYRAKELPQVASLEDISAIGVVTPHLLSNVAAATALLRSCDVSPEVIGQAIRTFKLDGHRIEFIAEQDGIKYFDDSKATNAHAAEASLVSFDSIVWIVGGLLKGVDIGPLVSRNSSKLRAAIVIGSDRTEVLAKFAEFAPDVQVIEISVQDNKEVMPAAVRAARSVAQKGDVVLLAPAAASMDQFKDYADRGNLFAMAVRSEK